MRDLHVRGESKGNEARRILVRGEGEVKVGEAGTTGPRRVEGTGFRVDAIPRRRASKWPREVEIDSGGNFRTREGVSWGSPWIKPWVRARKKVETEGEPKARWRYET